MKYPRIVLFLMPDVRVIAYVSSAQGQGTLCGVWPQTPCGGNASLRRLPKETRGSFSQTKGATAQRKLSRVFEAQGTEGAIVVPPLHKTVTGEGEASVRSDSACGAQDVWWAVRLLRQRQSEVSPARPQEQRWSAGTRASASSHSGRKFFQIRLEQASSSRFTAALCELSSRQTLRRMHGGRS